MKKLGFGLMRLPLTDRQEPTSIDYPALNQMVDDYLAHGFTHFDTAYLYHNGASEPAFRESVAKRYPRSAFTVTDKMPVFMLQEPAQLESIFTEQLERCGVEYFDYYWLHSLTAARCDTCEELGAFSFLESQKQQGRIRHTGISFHDSAEVLEHILSRHPELEYVQLQINYLDWESESIQSRKCYEIAVKYGKKVMVMEPVKGGVLASVPPQAAELFKRVQPHLSVPSWGLRYAASLEAAEMVLSGMTTPAQMQDNISVMENFQSLTGEEYHAVEQAVAIIRAGIAIPCTACRYCTDVCPQKIAIPEYFSLYNNFKMSGRAAPVVELIYFGTLSKTNGKPSTCVECGQCEQNCPQHIPIVQQLKQVAQTFDST